MKNMGSAYLLFLLVNVYTYIDGTQSYGSGAPKPACTEARPWHSHPNGTLITPLPAQGNPFKFVVTGTEYTPGSTVEVSIVAEGSDPVRGFFLQGRSVSDDLSVGTFSASLPANSQFLECDQAGDTVTHTNPTNKTGLTFTWQAPSPGVGPMHFVGSVAVDHDNFYIGITSDTLQEAASSTMQPTPTPTNYGERLSIRVSSIVLAIIPAMLSFLA